MAVTISNIGGKEWSYRAGQGILPYSLPVDEKIALTPVLPTTDQGVDYKGFFTLSKTEEKQELTTSKSKVIQSETEVHGIFALLESNPETQGAVTKALQDLKPIAEGFIKGTRALQDTRLS
jgi:hypothetical protein